jgi:hypothetical protein
MTEFLFFVPLWFPISLIALGIGTFVYGNNRAQRQLTSSGIGLIVLSCMVWIVSYAIDTPSERCVARTRTIVRAVNDGDWGKLREQLNAGTMVLDLVGPDAIGEAVAREASRHDVKRATVLGLSTTRAGSAITVDVSVYSEQKAPPAFRTQWQFQYETRADGILLAKIVPVSGENASAGQIERALRRYGGGR